MAAYTKISKLGADQVLEKAIRFFGPQGNGLTITQQGEACITFEGGGGYVAISLCGDPKGMRVDLETREWDYDVQTFMGKI